MNERLRCSLSIRLFGGGGGGRGGREEGEKGRKA